ncbi:hydrogenase 3 membrane subunit [Photobacterium angustum]|uniref:respiratory chain complex I subunit 1 family protein n=1 Tax=Photobacterium angustum TaxID=661 RepID=UPI0005EA2C25|nr:respiratory chain complex I subunit 1 family protein [Photobacterium angustum]KJF94236.1 hydrogenase 3 membrane subunit [Photobacterium angustum]KJG06440.1 hydrogenase 3 membrane subunit [Photobacterium angustum]PSV94128.1 hydrogenase 3 membrane subunit [Photobacterium angustum]PSW78562.1 hydrogenase 3 membrane subunit [Photobacterium angustum]
MPVLEMPSASMIALALTQALLMVLLAPLVTGFSRVIRAKMHSRQGPGLLQDYRDIIKLLRRQEVAPATAGIIFFIMPVVLMITMLLIGMALPTVTNESPFPIAGDVITDIYLFAIFRFFFSLSGLDSGSMFAGVGSSRELTLGVLVEPILMLSIFTMALIAGTSDLGLISSHMATQPWVAPGATVLAGIACAFVVFIEMGKLPFDCAEAEQELQEGPVTEYAGSGLAMVKLGLGLKQLVVAQLFIAIFIPFGKATELTFSSLTIATVILLAKLFVLFLLAGLVENSVARTRFIKTHHLTWVGFGVAVLGFIFYLTGL